MMAGPRMMLDSTRAVGWIDDRPLDGAVDDLAPGRYLAERLEREPIALEGGVGSTAKAPPAGRLAHPDVAADLIDPLGQHVQLTAGPRIDIGCLAGDAGAEHRDARGGRAPELRRSAAAGTAQSLTNVDDGLRPLLGAVHHHDRLVLTRLLASEQRRQALPREAVREMKNEGLAVQESREGRQRVSKALAGLLDEPVRSEGPVPVEGVAGLVGEPVARHDGDLAHARGTQPVERVPEQRPVCDRQQSGRRGLPVSYSEGRGIPLGGDGGLAGEDYRLGGLHG